MWLREWPKRRSHLEKPKSPEARGTLTLSLGPWGTHDGLRTASDRMTGPLFGDWVCKEQKREEEPQ